MELNSFDARTAANTAKLCKLRHPVTGKPMFDGDKLGDETACGVFVRGTESREVQARLAEVRRARAKEEKGASEVEGAGVDQLHERLARDMVPLITGFQNLQREGRDLEATEDDIKWFLNLQLINIQRDDNGEDLSFLGQVAAFSTNRGNWLGN